VKSNNINSCKINRSDGKQYTIFLPSSNKETADIVDELNKQFDHLLVTPVRCDDSELDDSCQAGIEISAIRGSSRSTTEQDFADMNDILKIVNPKIRGNERPILRSIREGIKVYNNHETKTV
jgi:hypothetical protein